MTPSRPSQIHWLFYSLHGKLRTSAFFASKQIGWQILANTLNSKGYDLFQFSSDLGVKPALDSAGGPCPCGTNRGPGGAPVPSPTKASAGKLRHAAAAFRRSGARFWAQEANASC